MRFNICVRRKRNELIERLKAFAPKYVEQMKDLDDIELIPFVIKFLNEENKLEDLLDETEMIYRGMR